MSQTTHSTDSRTKTALFEQRHYGVYWGILLVALLLLACLPSEAAWLQTQRGWFIQPMLGPLLGLGIFALFAAVRVVESIRNGYLQYLAHNSSVESVFSFLSSYRTALISAGLFFLYINTLSLLGFVLTSLLFVITLLWFSRLLDRTWLLATIGTLTVMVLIFRVGVNVWLPDVWLYNLLPDEWAVFANQYL